MILILSIQHRNEKTLNKCVKTDWHYAKSVFQGLFRQRLTHDVTRQIMITAYNCTNSQDRPILKF
jgi:hypothetical protein